MKSLQHLGPFELASFLSVYLLVVEHSDCYQHPLEAKLGLGAFHSHIQVRKRTKLVCLFEKLVHLWVAPLL